MKPEVSDEAELHIASFAKQAAALFWNVALRVQLGHFTAQRFDLLWLHLPMTGEGLRRIGANALAATS